MKNQENIEYTYKHRKIVKYLAEKYIQKNKKEKIKQIEEIENIPFDDLEFDDFNK